MKAIKTITLCCLLLSLTLSLFACSAEELSYRQISSDEAKALMETESDYIILDVRRADEFVSGHIKGALNLPNEEISGDELTENITSLLPDQDQLILVYCRSGRRSKEAASKLASLGYTNITEFGGIIDWTGETVTGS